MFVDVYRAGAKMGEAIANSDDGNAANSSAALRAASSFFKKAGQENAHKLAEKLSQQTPGRSDLISRTFHEDIQSAMGDKAYQVVSTGWLMGRAKTALNLVKAAPRDDEETKRRVLAAKKNTGQWLSAARQHYIALQEVYKVSGSANGQLATALSSVDRSQSIGDLRNIAQQVSTASDLIRTAVKDSA